MKAFSPCKGNPLTLHDHIIPMVGQSDSTQNSQNFVCILLCWECQETPIRGPSFALTQDETHSTLWYWNRNVTMDTSWFVLLSSMAFDMSSIACSTIVFTARIREKYFRKSSSVLKRICFTQLGGRWIPSKKFNGVKAPYLKLEKIKIPLHWKTPHFRRERRDDHIYSRRNMQEFHFDTILVKCDVGSWCGWVFSDSVGQLAKEEDVSSSDKICRWLNSIRT